MRGPTPCAFFLTKAEDELIDSGVKDRRMPVLKVAAASVAIVILVWFVFGQTAQHQFVNFDDESYVYSNPAISHGLSAGAIGWAFTHTLSHNWHPLTALSHMLDCQLFDLQPGSHHVINVLLHALSAILLLIALLQMTGAFWRSAFVATIFAIHPLHVESVAWIAERKDVLSAFFFMVTLITYTAYARSPSPWRYSLMAALFACGLMSKPMLVTVPIILLLLDYWPLRRFEDGDITLSRLLLEKLPLLLMAAAVGAVTIFIQRHGIGSEQIALPWRIANAVVSSGIYLWQTIWPLNLAVFYPHLGSKLPIWQIVVAVIPLAGISIAALMFRQTRPYFFCGWFWFVIMLLPVIGIIQVGDQAHADRYMYLPQIGFALAIVWGVEDLSRQWQSRTLILGSAAGVLIGFFVWRASVQTTFWRNSHSLWEHTLAVTTSNDLAHERLASAFLDEKRPDDAIVQAELALSIKSANAAAENDLGAALSRRGQAAEALKHFHNALQLDSGLSTVHYNIANALAATGATTEAITEYEKQLEINPDFAEAHNNLSLLLLRTGKIAEAEAHVARALALKPNYPDAHNNLAIVLSQSGRIEEAIGQWEKTVSIDANNLDANANLAWVLATSPSDAVRNGPAALGHAERALNLSHQADPRIWRLVAVAQAELGNFDAAIDAAQKGLRLAREQSNTQLEQTLAANLQSFRERLPVRDSSQSSVR